MRDYYAAFWEENTPCATHQPRLPRSSAFSTTRSKPIRPILTSNGIARLRSYVSGCGRPRVNQYAIAYPLRRVAAERRSPAKHPMTSQHARLPRRRRGCSFGIPRAERRRLTILPTPSLAPHRGSKIMQRSHIAEYTALLVTPSIGYFIRRV